MRNDGVCVRWSSYATIRGPCILFWSAWVWVPAVLLIPASTNTHPVRKLAGDGSSGYVPATTHVGDLDWIPGFSLTQPRLLWAFGEWPSGWEICISNKAKKERDKEEIANITCSINSKKKSKSIFSYNNLSIWDVSCNPGTFNQRQPKSSHYVSYLQSGKIKKKTSDLQLEVTIVIKYDLKFYDKLLKQNTIHLTTISWVHIITSRLLQVNGMLGSLTLSELTS